MGRQAGGNGTDVGSNLVPHCREVWTEGRGGNGWLRLGAKNCSCSSNVQASTYPQKETHKIKFWVNSSES